MKKTSRGSEERQSMSDCLLRMGLPWRQSPRPYPVALHSHGLDICLVCFNPSGLVIHYSSTPVLDVEVDSLASCLQLMGEGLITLDNKHMAVDALTCPGSGAFSSDRPSLITPSPKHPPHLRSSGLTFSSPTAPPGRKIKPYSPPSACLLPPLCRFGKGPPRALCPVIPGWG